MQKGKGRKSILVLGGTGHYGNHIVRSILTKGEIVRVLSRNSQRARDILGNEPEIIEGDITSRASVIKSLKETKAIVISISAMSRKLARKTKIIERDSVLMVLEEAEKAGISRIIYISVYDLRENIIDKFKIQQGKIKIEVEEKLKKTDFNWTVLGAPPSSNIFFSMIRGSTMNVPGGGPPALPTVSPIDLGEIVAQTVIRTDLGRRRFRIAGPRAYSFIEAAELISKVTGKKIKFRKIPLLPLRIASIVSYPFNPYLWHLYRFVQLLNSFPQDIVTKVPEDHQKLRDTFEFNPTSLEESAKMWYNQELTV
ncbi:MAG: SDR family oxidoreductase [Candidatus Hodarchaeota archaeon]